VAAATSTDGLTAEQQKLKTERFTALGWDDAKVAERKATIAAKSYEFDWLMLLLTAIVVITYFVFLVRTSDKELREVINERFGPSTCTQSKETS
jgi:3-deoxy-D-manno-octulosonic-acid transferase